MPDPIRIDEAFQETMEAIESAKSYRYIFYRFRHFSTLLEGEYLKFQSYLFQLFDELPVYTLPLMWSGLDPEIICDDADLLLNISDELSSNTIDDVIERLREVAFLQFICLSEPGRADQQFIHLFGMSLFKKKSDGVTGNTCDNLSYTKEKLQAFAESRELTRKQRKAADQLLKDIGLLLQRGELEALIPVAEENDGGEGAISGRLRKVMLQESGTNSSKDTIIRYYPVVGAEPVSGIDTSVVTSRARSLAEEKSSRLRSEFFDARLYYEINGAEHAGDSGNLALGALWYTFLLKQAELRERYTIAGDTALTGDINNAGKVLPVDPNTVQAKAEAAFFSWANLLAVPISQYSLFSEQIRKLKERYPARKLSLIGVEKLEDLFYDRSLTDYVVENRFTYAVRKLKKEKFKTVVVPVIVLLLLIIARMMYGPVDRNAVDLEVTGSQLVLKNSAGATVESFTLDESTADYMNIRSNFLYQSLSLLVNINKDDRNELILASRANYETNQIKSDNPEVKAYSLSGDSLIWQKKLFFNYIYPKQSMTHDAGLRISEIGLMETERGEKLIVSAQSRMYFYSIVFGLDLKTGVIEKEYVHPGSINDVIILDINGDGYDELVIAGINNAYWNAMLGVMKYDELSGYSPVTTVEYVPLGLSRAEQDLYLLLPKTAVGEYFSKVYKYNNASRIIYNSSTEIIQLTVQEGNTSFSGLDQPIRLIFDFNSRLEPVGIGTYDIYDIFARNLYQEGEIPFEPDYEYFEALQDSIQYWDGEKFVYTQEYFSGEDE